MTTALNAAVLLFDLLFTPFVLGVLSITTLRWLQRRPRAWRPTIMTGVACMLVHIVGVFLQLWNDGDWLGYLIMVLTVSVMAMTSRR